MQLFENERMDEVNEHLSLIQKTDGLTFGTDALLLASYLYKNYPTAIEFGAGSGIISMLLLTRKKADRITALEIQREYAELTDRNAALNGLSEKLSAVHTDLRTYKCDPVDLIFSNPPYMKTTSGARNTVDAKTVARHETAGGIADFCDAARRLLRYGGTFAVVYRPDRLPALLTAMRDAKIEPKRMTFVHASAGCAPSSVLVEGRAGGKEGLYLTPPLILYRDATHTDYSDEMREILTVGTVPKIFRSPKP